MVVTQGRRQGKDADKRRNVGKARMMGKGGRGKRKGDREELSPLSLRHFPMKKATFSVAQEEDRYIQLNFTIFQDHTISLVNLNRGKVTLN